MVRAHCPAQRKRLFRAFTLLELLLSIAIIGVVAAIVITAVNPSRQISKAQDIKRQSDANQLQKALSQYLIDSGSVPDPTKFPTGATSVPMPICSPSATDKTVCLDATALVGKYIAAIPVDPAEACGGVTGYLAYRDNMGPHIVQQHDSDFTTCPVSVDWTDAANGKVMNGTATISTNIDLTGKTLRVYNGSTLNLNGHNVTGSAIINNGTIAAQGNETVTANSAAGSWKITGPSGNLNVLANQSNISSLTLSPSSAATYAPVSALSITGNLTVGSTATLDTTSASNTAVGSVLNNGTIVLGDNANTITFGSYDSVNGATVIAGSLVRSGLTYHDLTINSPTAVLSGTTAVNGALTVNASKALAMNGNTLVTSGNVILQGTLTGQGTLNLGNGGNSVTVANGSSLSGADSAHKMLLTALNSWYLQNSGTLSYLNLTKATSITSTTCSFCTDGGGNSVNISYLNCGNGAVDAGEACDDSNTAGGDGCSATCQVESGWSCTGTPSWCTRNVTVNDGPYALTVLGTKVFVASYNAGTVSIIDTTNNYSVTNVTVGSYPRAMVVLGTKVYVANQNSANVSIIDTANGNSVTSVNVGSTPYALAVLGTKIYVTNSGGSTVSVIDTANGNSVTSVNVGTAPYGLAVLGTKIYVANKNSANVSIIDAANGNSVTSVNVGSGPWAVGVLGTSVYVTNSSSNTVSVIDTANANAVTTVNVVAGPIALTTLGTKVYVVNANTNYLSIIDSANGNSVTNLVIGWYPNSVIALGTKIYTANFNGSNAVSVIDTANGNAVSSVSVAGAPYAFAILGTNVYVADYNAMAVTIIGGH